jgi:hypothetical protein
MLEGDATAKVQGRVTKLTVPRAARPRRDRDSKRRKCDLGQLRVWRQSVAHECTEAQRGAVGQQFRCCLTLLSTELSSVRPHPGSARWQLSTLSGRRSVSKLSWLRLAAVLGCGHVFDLVATSSSRLLTTIAKFGQGLVQLFDQRAPLDGPTLLIEQIN